MKQYRRVVEHYFSNALSALIVAVLLVLSSTQAWASSSVWKITKGQYSIYLGGTIHVLSAQDYPLPKAFDIAYEKASVVVFETDIDKLEDPVTQEYFIRQVSYQEGTTLVDFLSDETYTELKGKLDSIGMPMQRMKHFKPGMISMTLTMHELQRLGMAETGVDGFYHHKSKQDQKTLGALESITTQIQFLADMGDGSEDELIRYTLNDIKTLPQLMSDTKAVWRNGNMAGLSSLMLEPVKQEFPALYQSLLVERNNNWMPQIESMIATPQTEFILVGALHLAGDVGLLSQLEQKGYQIEQLD